MICPSPRRGAVLLLLALLLTVSLARADVTLQQTAEAGKQAIQIENEYWRLSIWPEVGGRVRHAVYKPTGHDWCYENAGLFLDHVTQQVWPGELLDVPYEFEVKAKGPEQATVRLWRTIDGRGNAAIAGVVFEKVITLRAGDPDLHAIIRLRNPTDAPRAPVPWVQNMMFAGGRKEYNRYFRPTTTGVLEAWAEYGATDSQRFGQDSVREPIAGWTAVTDTQNGEGAAFLMKYDDLFWLYNCVGGLTVEWWYDPVPLTPGASWETPVTVVPFAGLTSVAYADERLIASLEPKYEDGKLSASLKLVSATAEALPQVSGQVEFRSHPQGQTLKTVPVTFTNVGRMPVAQELDLGPLAKTQEAIIRVSLKSGEYQSTFERHFDPMAAQKAQFGQINASYRIPKPRKQKQFALPEGARVQRHERPKVLLCEGLHTTYWGLDRALRQLGAETRVAHHTIFVYGDQLDYMPASPEELLQYDLIVLSNIPAEALTDVGQAFLQLYVEHGGALLILGGNAAYGAGSYADSGFASVLPVKVGGRFDRMPLKDGAPLQPAGKLGAALFDNWPNPAPRAFWAHEIAGLQPGAEVVMKAGDKPGIVVAPEGQGRVACVLLTPWGEAPPGTKGFWEWRGWPGQLVSLANWLTQRQGGN